MAANRRILTQFEYDPYKNNPGSLLKDFSTHIQYSAILVEKTISMVQDYKRSLKEHVPHHDIMLTRISDSQGKEYTKIIESLEKSIVKLHTYVEEQKKPHAIALAQYQHMVNEYQRQQQQQPSQGATENLLLTQFANMDMNKDKN